MGTVYADVCTSNKSYVYGIQKQLCLLPSIYSMNYFEQVVNALFFIH